MRIFLTLLIALVLSVPTFSQTRLKAGQDAPTFSLEALDGKIFDLSEAKGKAVLVTFWSTTCMICKEELPRLGGIYAKQDKSKVDFIAVTMEDAARATKFVNKYGVNLPVLVDGLNVIMSYADKRADGGIDMAFPSYFLIDQSGKIAYRGQGWSKTNEIETRLSEILATK